MKKLVQHTLQNLPAYALTTASNEEIVGQCCNDAMLTFNCTDDDVGRLLVSLVNLWIWCQRQVITQSTKIEQDKESLLFEIENIELTQIDMGV